MPRNKTKDSIENHNIPYKKLEGFDHDYYVTIDGRIWTNYRKNGIERFMKQHENAEGYKSVGLYIGGKQKRFRVHRLVAIMFIPNPDNKPYVNHIDGDKSNNHANNLEWCTQKENVHHAIGTLKKWSNSDTQREKASVLGKSKRKLSMEQAREVRLLHEKRDCSISGLAERYKISKTGIKRILNGKAYKEGDTCER